MKKVKKKIINEEIKNENENPIQTTEHNPEEEEVEIIFDEIKNLDDNQEKEDN